MESNLAVNQLTIAAGIVAFIQWLKKSNLPIFSWINAGTGRLNRIVSVVCAAASAQGIGVTWDTEKHALTLTGLTLAAVLGFLWHWIQQFGLQEWIYRSAIYKAPNAKGGNLTGAIGEAPKTG